MNAVDTNVLIYSIDASDDKKRLRAVELIESLPESDTVIPWQVACEVAAVIRTMSERGRFHGDAAAAIIALRSCFPIHLPHLTTLNRALAIQAAKQTSTWDSLLIAACADAGVSRLYTEDMQGQPTIDGVSFVNPFA